MNVLVDLMGHKEFIKSILVAFLLTFLIANFWLKKPQHQQLDQPAQAV